MDRIYPLKRKNRQKTIKKSIPEKRYYSKQLQFSCNIYYGLKRTGGEEANAYKNSFLVSYYITRVIS